MIVRFGIPDLVFCFGLKVGAFFGLLSRGYGLGAGSGLKPKTKLRTVRLGYVVGLLVGGVKNGFEIAKGGTA